MLGGLAVSALVVIWALLVTPWTKARVLPRLIPILAALGTAPLAFVRLDVELQEFDVVNLGLVPLAGTAVALVMGLPFLYFSGRLTTPELVRRLAAQYMAPKPLCDYFDSKLGQATTASEQTTAMALILTELAPILEANSALKPALLSGRRATASLKMALRRYIAEAKQYDRTIQQIRENVYDAAASDATTRLPRNVITQECPRP